MLAHCLNECASERPSEPLDAKVFRVRECQKALDRACKKVGTDRITHHDLRHLFATRCIECGVDIPTVSRWLGHKDGGALAMKTYGHLRREHSIAQAQRVTLRAGRDKAGRRDRIPGDGMTVRSGADRDEKNSFFLTGVAVHR